MSLVSSPLLLLLFAAITASPREQWFLLSQQFLPPLSLYIQDVSFTKHELVPPPPVRLTPVCFLSAAVSKLFSYTLPTFGAADTSRGKTLTVLSLKEKDVINWVLFKQETLFYTSEILR